MKFRLATIKDCKELTNIRLDMRKERETISDEAMLERNTMLFFEKNISKGSYVGFICEEEGQIIGTAGLTLFEMPPTEKLLNGKVAKLMNMYTVPEHRRKGVAREILDFAEQYARKNGYYKIMLNASPTARFLYEEVGFKLIENEYEYYIK